MSLRFRLDCALLLTITAIRMGPFALCFLTTDVCGLWHLLAYFHSHIFTRQRSARRLQPALSGPLCIHLLSFAPSNFNHTATPIQLPITVEFLLLALSFMYHFAFFFVGSTHWDIVFCVAYNRNLHTEFTAIQVSSCHLRYWLGLLSRPYNKITKHYYYVYVN